MSKDISTSEQDPAAVMRTYFDAWTKGDFERLRSVLADDADFAGPFGRARGVDECLEGMKGLNGMMDDDGAVVLRMAVNGSDVITWFELHTTGADPVPVANWTQVRDGKANRIRVTFDPRPLL